MTDINTLSDREVLELAAKFCGIDGTYIEWCSVDETCGIYNEDERYWFNPLQNVDDRARACDEHYITVEHLGMHCRATTPDGYCQRDAYAKHNKCRTTAANYAATRLMAMMQIEKEKGK